MDSIRLDVPADLHDALRRRAAAEGTDPSEYILRLIRRDLARPTLREWLAEARSHPVKPGLPSAADEIRAAREERIAHLDAVIRRAP